MANSGIKASNAGTAMRKMMTQLQGVVEVEGKGIGKVAIACSNADGSMRSLNDILADCRKAFSGMTEEEKASNAEALVGKTAMAGFLAVMNANEKDINKLSVAINNCDGVSQSMADTMNNNLKGQLTLLKSQIEGIAISFGNKLTPYVKEAVTWCQKVADKFNSLSDSQQKMIINIGLIVAAVGPARLIFGKLVTGVGKVVSIFGKVGQALKMAKSLFGLLTSPVGIVVGVLAALVAVGILVCKNWDKIKAAAKKVGNAIKSAFKASGASAEKFKSTFSKVKESIGKIVSNLAVIFGKI